MDDQPRTIRELSMYHRVASADLMAIAWQLGIQLKSASSPLSDIELQRLTTSDRFNVLTASVASVASDINEAGVSRPVADSPRTPLTAASANATSDGPDVDAKSRGGALLSALFANRRSGGSTPSFDSDSPVFHSKSDRGQTAQPEPRPRRSRRAKQSNRPTATLDEARRYFLGSRYLQEQYRGGQLVGPDAVQHLSTALRISVERAQRYLHAIDEAIAAEIAARSQQDSDRIVTPGFVAASGLASVVGFAIGLLSGYKGKYK